MQITQWNNPQIAIRQSIAILCCPFNFIINESYAMICLVGVWGDSLSMGRGGLQTSGHGRNHRRV